MFYKVTAEGTRFAPKKWRTPIAFPTNTVFKQIDDKYFELVFCADLNLKVDLKGLYYPIDNIEYKLQEIEYDDIGEIIEFAKIDYFASQLDVALLWAKSVNLEEDILKATFDICIQEVFNLGEKQTDN